MMNDRFTPTLDIARLYRRFDAPVTEFDCGQKCSVHNPSGKPFCCDICHAVPVAYRQELQHLQPRTDLWHEWRGDECANDPCDPADLRAQTSEHMLLLACKGPAHCQRDYRSTSCRQFPFFPYITADDRFLGLALEWDFAPVCWVISNLASVTPTFRREFVQTYDELLATWPDEFESYALTSEQMREHFAEKKQRIPLLHRNGHDYLLSPKGERLQRVSPEQFRKYGPYRQA